MLPTRSQRLQNNFNHNSSHRFVYVSILKSVDRRATINASIYVDKKMLQFTNDNFDFQEKNHNAFQGTTAFEWMCK